MRLIGLAVVLTIGVVLAPLAAQTQQAAKVQRVGYLGYDAPGSDPTGISGLRQGLRDLGYIENQNIVIEYRFAEGQPNRLPALISELTNLKVAVLITQGTEVTAAAKRATATTPIVTVSGDPVGLGFVESMAHPGGNITGLSFAQGEAFSGKWLELIKETMPKASRVGIIWNPANRSMTGALKLMELLAPGLGLQVSSHTVRSAADIDAAFAAVSKAPVAAVIVLTSTSSGSESATRWARRCETYPDNLRYSRVRRRRGTDVLRPQSLRPVAAVSRLCGQDPQGREACRPSSRATH
jgi:putative tryptophan/tyrosine transport system substrate-binding protein